MAKAKAKKIIEESEYVDTRKPKRRARRTRREPVEIVIPPPWDHAKAKPGYLEALHAEKNKARLKLSGQLLAVMHGQTEEKDGDPIPAPVRNLGMQLSGLVDQVATKAAIKEFAYMKMMYERERVRLIEEKAVQDKAKTAEAAKAQRGHTEIVAVKAEDAGRSERVEELLEAK